MAEYYVLFLGIAAGKSMHERLDIADSHHGVPKTFER